MSDLSNAMARAARSVGRNGLAELIEDERLSRLLALSLSASNLKDAAPIVTTALVAAGDHWSEKDRELAVSLVGSERFREIIEQAGAFA